ncbi:radical SAM protein [Desulfotomaculum copahuensis]|uniref:Radical SAM protein n=1 Tax=Desulfotomaculum copahuensis TaxID=1838280 RepID=A0A1B7LG77_9FIRM|nr:radical SAM protein [Desulfotomaculum copahuensis]OAT84845.1 radical SAM protein [Desulfotomaculum copahuensis]
MVHLRHCTLCPRRCGANREAGKNGFCCAPARPKIALASLHFGEEPCISGTAGSGTVFFSHCNLKCVFCQNHEISQGGFGREVDVEQLAQIFIKLQEKGAHNINLVSPTPYVPVISPAIKVARRRGLAIPVVYNTNAYENVETLALLEGLVDIYLPDLKYFSAEPARRYSAAPDYFHAATAAIKEMYRQVGTPVLDKNGLARRGLIIRHLVLPGQVADSIHVLHWIAGNLPREVYISLMAQYFPAHRAVRIPPLDRRLRVDEYEDVVNCLLKLGLQNGFVQEMEAATEEYVPDFNLYGVPESATGRSATGDGPVGMHTK